MSDRPPNKPQPPNEFGQLRSYLARMGYTQAQIKEAIGSTPNGRTRSEIAGQLKLWIIENLGD